MFVFFADLDSFSSAAKNAKSHGSSEATPTHSELRSLLQLVAAVLGSCFLVNTFVLGDLNKSQTAASQVSVSKVRSCHLKLFIAVGQTLNTALS